MKSAIAALLGMSLIVLIGCQQSAPPASSTASLGFRVNWPGVPNEFGPDNVGQGSWNYLATYLDKERHLHYSASATELGPAVANMAPRELLANFKAGLQSQEISRVETEYSPAKLSAFEIYARAGGE